MTAYNNSYLKQRVMHPEELVLFESEVQIFNQESGLLKDRYAVLCPTRLLLFKEKPLPLSQALAVYPTVQAEFYLDAATVIVMEFAEQVNRHDSKPCGPTLKRKFFFISESLTSQWLAIFK